MKTKIFNAWILTMNEQLEEIPCGEIVFEEDQIIYVGEKSEIQADNSSQ